LSTSQHSNANLFNLLCNLSIFSSHLVELFSQLGDILKCTCEMFGTSCTILFVYTHVLTCKHS